ncbi:hypothetical protein KSS87_003114 [Heliosperma pusillum]|nr:hypothetical protein KSS87_003114 [Heliosperma pusillum]
METQTISTAKLGAPWEFSRRLNQASQLPIFLKFPSLISNTSINCKKDGIKSDVPSKKMFIFGMGYVSQFFAHELKNQGWDISGTCTSITKKKELEEKGFDAHVFDACQPEWKILDILSCYTHLLVSVPPIENIGDPVLQHQDHLRSRLLRGNFQWLGYLSSTSVYGDSKGAWVDEDFSPQPSRNVGKLRLSAEEGWLKLGHDLGLSPYVFRLGGIYGSGRSAIDTLLKKRQLSDSQKRRGSRNFTSRVHVADICQALKASISAELHRQSQTIMQPSIVSFHPYLIPANIPSHHHNVLLEIYNVVDDDPTPRAEVFEFAEQLINKRWPGLVTPNESFIQKTDPIGGEKRVSNARMKNELGVRLCHPSYRSGLQSIIDHMPDPVS